MFFCDWLKTKRRCCRIILLFFLLAQHGCAYPLQQARYGDEGIPVRFTFKAPEARRVFLAGSFNQWSTSTLPMNRESSYWSITMQLPKGRYQYAFVVDGLAWQHDPGAQMFEDNGFGAVNSVLIVE